MRPTRPASAAWIATRRSRCSSRCTARARRRCRRRGRRGARGRGGGAGGGSWRWQMADGRTVLVSRHLPSAIRFQAKRTALRRPFPSVCYLFVDLARRHVGRLQSLRSLHEIELDRRSFGKRAKAFGLDRREVHEHILAAFHRDETKTLSVIEPFDLTGAAHLLDLLLVSDSRFQILTLQCRTQHAVSANKFQARNFICNRYVPRKTERVASSG